MPTATAAWQPRPRVRPWPARHCADPGAPPGPSAGRPTQPEPIRSGRRWPGKPPPGRAPVPMRAGCRHRPLKGLGQEPGGQGPTPHRGSPAHHGAFVRSKGGVDLLTTRQHQAEGLIGTTSGTRQGAGHCSAEPLEISVGDAVDAHTEECRGCNPRSDHALRGGTPSASTRNLAAFLATAARREAVTGEARSARSAPAA